MKPDGTDSSSSIANENPVSPNGTTFLSQTNRLVQR